MYKQKLYDEQAFRQQKFPPDRICFYTSANSAQKDQSDMAAWKNGEITLPMLCVRLAHNNFLEEVTEAQALKALKDLGWR